MEGNEITPELLMAYLDGELPAGDAARFRDLLERHPEWRDEAARLGAVVQAADGLRFAPPPPGVWDNYWEEIDSRLGRRGGWLVTGFGGAIVAAYGVYRVLMFAENMWVRTGLGLVIVGLLILFVSVLRGRLLELPKDRYGKIRR